MYGLAVIVDMCLLRHLSSPIPFSPNLSGKVFARALKWLYTKAYRWNVKRKWKQTVNFEGLGSDEQLDEAYMDELEQQVIQGYTYM